MLSAQKIDEPTCPRSLPEYPEEGECHLSRSCGEHEAKNHSAKGDGSQLLLANKSNGYLIKKGYWWSAHDTRMRSQLWKMVDQKSVWQQGQQAGRKSIDFPRARLSFFEDSGTSKGHMAPAEYHHKGFLGRIGCRKEMCSLTDCH